MNTIRICTNCRAPLPADAPAGLCPACLLQSNEPSAVPPTHLSASTIAATVSRVVPRPGEDYGDYHILRLLGQGGMGEVYEAIQRPTGRRVALKVMNQSLASDQDRKRFLREGRLAAGVSHPNVVYIFGSEEISGSPVIAMELVGSGTLRDRLKRGPLPPVEAVEATLQMIAGLEAAHVTGVLHRDIKPANCFIGNDGTLKVGDFGLSISTIARGESLLTASGSVLGTPAYASPEQLRGEDLDIAADIYSVGASLYHLLTGRLPYEATDFVKLITEVLDKVPTSPDVVRPGIPSGLAAVVMRCLAKDRDARYASYAALREALLPFSSTAPTPAVLGLRFIAGAIDELLVYIPSFFVLLWMGRDLIERFVIDRTTVTAIGAALFLLWDLLYYAITEGFWSKTLGKAICGLRVIGPERSRPGFARALARALVYRTTWSIPLVATLFLYTSTQYLTNSTEGNWSVSDWLWLPITAILFSTMRRRNGYAALHDLVSGTRVISRPSAEERPRLNAPGFVATNTASTLATSSSLSTQRPALAPPANRATSNSPAPFGPFEILNPLSSDISLAHDPALRRNLWIRQHPAGAVALSTRRRDLSRPTRLRWLNGQRDEANAWDAYEALDGAPLLALPPQGWDIVRFWLHDLAEEFAAGEKHDSLPPVFALNRIWITSHNRAVVLDFPCPGFPDTPSNYQSIGTSSGESGGVSFSQFQGFLQSVVRHMLDGQSGHTNPPPPLHAQSFLQSLAGARFESAEILVGNLRSLLGRTAEVTRPRRWATLGVAFSPAIILALALAATLWFENRRINRTWPTEFGDSAELRAELIAFHTFGDHPAVETAGLKTDPGEDALKRLRRMFRVHIASHHRELIENTNFWAHPAVAKVLTSEYRQIATEAAADYRDVSPERLNEADALVRLLQPGIRAADSGVPEWAGLGVFWAIIIFVAFLDLGSVVIIGESLFLRLLGIGVVQRDGSKASRFHLLARTIITWISCVVGAGLSLTLWFYWLPGIQAAPAVLTWTVVGTTLALAIALFFSLRNPARSLADRIVGTWLVPR